MHYNLYWIYHNLSFYHLSDVRMIEIIEKFKSYYILRLDLEFIVHNCLDQ
jgi:hypothetical protein